MFFNLQMTHTTAVMRNTNIKNTIAITAISSSKGNAEGTRIFLVAFMVSVLFVVAFIVVFMIVVMVVLMVVFMMVLMVVPFSELTFEHSIGYLFSYSSV